MTAEVVGHIPPAATGRRIQVYLGALLVALVAAAIVAYSLVDRSEDPLAGFAHYSVAETTGQAALDFQRFQKAVLEFGRNRTPANLDEVKARFAALKARTLAISPRERALLAETAPAYAAVPGDLDAAVRAVDSMLRDAGTGLAVEPILAVTSPVETGLIGAAAETDRRWLDRYPVDQAMMTGIHQQLQKLVFGLIFCGLFLVGTLVWHNRLLAGAHRDLVRTTGDLKKTASELAAAHAAVAAANAELTQQNARLSEQEQALRSRNVLFDAALNNMSQGLCMLDAELRPVVCNAGFAQMFGLSQDQLAAHASLRALVPDIAARIAENVRRLHAAEFETERDDGRIIAVTQRPMSGGGWVATFEDVTEKRRAEARIAHMARHDGLTNLPNRYLFRERLRSALRDAAANGAMLAVLCVDIDNFKEVNDSLGHPVGDALLCAVAERLARSVRDTDMVARFGGDEFAVLQPAIARAEDADRLAMRIVETLRKPFIINGETVYSAASVGVALAPVDGDDPDVLLKSADLALYDAKSDGKRTYRFFESAMNDRLAHRHVLAHDLRRALTAGELELHYQPTVNLRTLRMSGVEALLRWRHPERGIISPTTFIPIAEDAGLITEIGRWALMTACRDAARWPAHLKVAVNLSAAQFREGDIVDDVRAALSRAGLRPERLILEITESLLLGESAATFETLNRLKALRVEIAMDDFGTGYSSLSYLRNYSFDSIKIDREFVGGAKNAPIIQAIVQLAQALGMTTVAEGIESAEDLAMLRAAGCSEGQGFLFSEAVPAARILEMIETEGSWIDKVA